MNIKNTICIAVITIILVSCLGDKKQVNVAEMNDTSSFINKNFKGNLINYSKGMSACDNISVGDIANLYNVSAEKVHIEDPTKSDRYKKDMAPMCSFYIEDGENDYLWLKGSIDVQREIQKDETAYDIAKAAGNGAEWEEAWALNKSISKSSQWVKDMGKAALWNDRKKVLKIKFDGYTLSVYPLKNMLNKADAAKNRDYKQITIAMAKAAGYIK